MLNIEHPHEDLFTKLTFELITLIFVIMSVCDYISMRYRISIYRLVSRVIYRVERVLFNIIIDLLPNDLSMNKCSKEVYPVK